MSVKALKLLARSYALNISTCFEKAEIIDKISQRELRKRYNNECLAKFAYRIALRDASRNCMSTDELCSFDWNIRIKGSGPLGSLAVQDPWWHPELLPPAESSSGSNADINSNDISSSSSSTSSSSSSSSVVVDGNSLLNISSYKPTTTLVRFHDNGWMEYKFSGPGPFQDMMRGTVLE